MIEMGGDDTLGIVLRCFVGFGALLVMAIATVLVLPVWFPIWLWRAIRDGGEW